MRFILGPRDRQDREAEWRKHAIELSKLDLDRKLKTRSANDMTPLRPSILDFLANYRDLQELGTKSPKELYLDVEKKRIAARTSSSTAPMPALQDSPVSPAFVVATLILGLLLVRRWAAPEWRKTAADSCLLLVPNASCSRTSPARSTTRRAS
jgi:hypothetical protein